MNDNKLKTIDVYSQWAAQYSLIFFISSPIQSHLANVPLCSSFGMVAKISLTPLQWHTGSALSNLLANGHCP